MAKELPYFKFEPNQWENGNIQICNRHDKGLFMDLCSMYWSRTGNLSLKLAIQKLCDGNASAFDSLIEEKIFEVIDGMICIDFLNEQLQEFEDTSEQNRRNALIGWEKRRKKPSGSDGNASASNPQSESDARRGEKRKGEKIIDKHTIDSSFEYDGLLKYFNDKTGRNESRVTSTVKGNVKARLFEMCSDGDSLEDAKQKISLAIRKAATDKWLKDNNVLTLVWITSEDNFYKWLNADIKKPRTQANP